VKSTASPAHCRTPLCGSPQGPGWAAGRTGGHRAAWPDPAGASGEAAADGKGGGCRGSRSKQEKAHGTPPRKCCILTPAAARINTQFEAWKEPDDQLKKKKASDQSLLYFAIFFSNLLQYCCRGSSKLIHSALLEGHGSDSCATGLAKARALFSPTTLSALLVLSMHSTNLTHSNESPASGNHEAGITVCLCSGCWLPAPPRRWLLLPGHGLGLQGSAAA